MGSLPAPNGSVMMCSTKSSTRLPSRLLDKCDAVLRVGGASAGADEMVHVGRELGLLIYHGLDEIEAVY
jgi:molybdopterin biosynthesis enzyme